MSQLPSHEYSGVYVNGHRPQAVLFDLDGTLVDSLEDLSESMNQALALLGCPPHAHQRYRRLIGEGVPMLAFRALPPERRDAETVARLAAQMERIYAERGERATTLYPGIAPLLADLAAMGIPLGVFSNKLDELTRALVNRLLPDITFGEIRGSRPQVPRKPDPAGALQIAASMNIAPENWLFVGDTPIDIATAHAAGMVAVGVAWGFRPDELDAAGADSIVEQPADILRLISRAREQ